MQTQHLLTDRGKLFGVPWIVFAASIGIVQERNGFGQLLDTNRFITIAQLPCQADEVRVGVPLLLWWPSRCGIIKHFYDLTIAEKTVVS